MTPLGRRIARLIESTGPIGIADYMALCLFDPTDGYYTTRQPFGPEGDFTTAPEISQMFGELIGVWVHLAWEAIGRPEAVTVAEIGPGRGTLMADMLRTIRKVSPALHDGAAVAMIEASPHLAEVQKATLANQGKPVEWHATVATLANAPLIIIGNELFDAVPMRQYVKTNDGWRERCVGLRDGNGLCFVAGAGALDPALLPPDATAAPHGAIVELAPARGALMQQTAQHLADHGGAGLFIDYGYVTPAVGDTLQALLRHEFDDPLANPGNADLTSHVDFAALAAAARQAGLDANILDQGDFLLALGLLERAGRLGATFDEAGRATIHAAVERIAGPDQMGQLFKALAITPHGILVPSSRS